MAHQRFEVARFAAQHFRIARTPENRRQEHSIITSPPASELGPAKDNLPKTKGKQAGRVEWDQQAGTVEPASG